MTPDDLGRFAGGFKMLCMAHGQESSEALTEVYWQCLGDLPVEDVMAGMTRAMRGCARFPPVPELRRLCGTMTQEMRAMQAWAALKRAVTRHGAYRSVSFSDPAVNATVRNLGGWSKVCDTPAGDEFDKWLRKDFERIYAAYVAQGHVTEEEGRYLAGIHEHQNAATGHMDAIPPIRKEAVQGVEPVRVLGAVASGAGGTVRGLINEAVKEG